MKQPRVALLGFALAISCATTPPPYEGVPDHLLPGAAAQGDCAPDPAQLVSALNAHRVGLFVLVSIDSANGADAPPAGLAFTYKHVGGPNWVSYDAWSAPNGTGRGCSLHRATTRLSDEDFEGALAAIGTALSTPLPLSARARNRWECILGPARDSRPAVAAVVTAPATEAEVSPAHHACVIAAELAGRPDIAAAMRRDIDAVLSQRPAPTPEEPTRPPDP